MLPRRLAGSNGGGGAVFSPLHAPHPGGSTAPLRLRLSLVQHFINTLTNPFVLILRDGAKIPRLLRMTGEGRRPLTLGKNPSPLPLSLRRPVGQSRRACPERVEGGDWYSILPANTPPYLRTTALTVGAASIPKSAITQTDQRQRPDWSREGLVGCEDERGKLLRSIGT